MLRHGWSRALQQRSGVLTAAGRRALCRGYSLETDSVDIEVCFIDPAFLLHPERLHRFKSSSAASSIHPYVCLHLPAQLVQQLRGGRFQLGDRDDPESHWLFGREGEVFQYKYAGSITVQSGLASAVPAEAVQQAERGEVPGGGQAPSWLQLVASLEESGGPPAPFLFAGRVVDCDSAGVYKLAGGGGEMEGVMLSSEYESAGAD